MRETVVKAEDEEEMEGREERRSEGMDRQGKDKHAVYVPLI